MAVEMRAGPAGVAHESFGAGRNVAASPMLPSKARRPIF
jgi:hypothetical protein